MHALTQTQKQEQTSESEWLGMWLNDLMTLLFQPLCFTYTHKRTQNGRLSIPSSWKIQVR